MCAARTVRLTGAIGLGLILGYSRMGKDTGPARAGAKAIYAAPARYAAVLMIQRAPASNSIITPGLIPGISFYRSNT